MAQYVTSFSEYTPEAQPADWTARWVTAGVTWEAVALVDGEGGVVLQHASTSDLRALLTWDDIDADADRDDVEVLVRFRTASTVDHNENIGVVAVRASGAAGAETGYRCLLLSNFGVPSLILNKVVGGASTNLGTVALSGNFNSRWRLLRLRAEGTAIKAKIWFDGDDEPSDWTIEATDSAVSGVGWVGAFDFESTETSYWDYFSVGTNGDSAPLVNVDSSTTLRATQLVAEPVSTTSPNLRATQIAVEALNEYDVKLRVTQMVVEILSTVIEAALEEAGMHVWQRSVVDAEGNIEPDALIEVRVAATNALATIYEDRDGETPKANPFQVDDDAFARFYADAGRYNITATSEGLEREWVDVELGVTISMLPDLTSLVSPIVSTILEEDIQPQIDDILEQLASLTQVAQFSIDENGAADAGMPDDWVATRLGVGRYEVTHNLQQNYIVQLTTQEPSVTDRVYSAVLVTKSLSKFTYRVRSIHDEADSGVDRPTQVSVFLRT